MFPVVSGAICVVHIFYYLDFLIMSATSHFQDENSVSCLVEEPEKVTF
jgi:hypothetical protein